MSKLWSIYNTQEQLKSCQTHGLTATPRLIEGTLTSVSRIPNLIPSLSNTSALTGSHTSTVIYEVIGDENAGNLEEGGKCGREGPRSFLRFCASQLRSEL